MQTQTNITVRWMIRRDLPRLAQIELDSVGGWDDDLVLRYIAQPQNIGMVAEIDGVVVGFVLYSLRADCIRISRVAVAQGHRRKGVGRELLTRLQDRLASHGHRRRKLTAAVPEESVGAQCFLRQCGFTGRLREGKIRFVYRIGG